MKRVWLMTSLGIFVVFAQNQTQAVSSHSLNIQDDIQALAKEDPRLEASFAYSPPLYDPTKNQSHIYYNEVLKMPLFKNKIDVDELPPLPTLNKEEAYREAKRIGVLLKQSVPHAITYSPAKNAEWIKLAKQEMERSGPPIKRAQILVVVDRNPKVQALCFVLALPKGEGEWLAIGGGRVSTGKQGRKLYYITPTGVFMNTPERIGYRALGTKNKNGIRGNGVKGMRVWDFGWQWAEKGWLPNREKGQIRLEMHATDPDYLERRLGNTGSEGCVRIAATMNKFIDHNGIIDVLYHQIAAKDKRFRAILPKNQKFTPIAGDALVVVDSSEKLDNKNS